MQVFNEKYEWSQEAVAKTFDLKPIFEKIFNQAIAEGWTMDQIVFLTTDVIGSVRAATAMKLRGGR
jgi:hypothetical protein